MSTKLGQAQSVFLAELDCERLGASKHTILKVLHPVTLLSLGYHTLNFTGLTYSSTIVFQS